MNLIYGALLLHSAGKDINEANMKKIAQSVGEADESQIKALVAALDGVNIKEIIEKAALPVAAPVSTAAAPVSVEEKKEEDTEKKAEEAAAGLSALFG